MSFLLGATAAPWFLGIYNKGNIFRFPILFSSYCCIWQNGIWLMNSYTGKCLASMMLLDSNSVLIAMSHIIAVTILYNLFLLSYCLSTAYFLLAYLAWTLLLGSLYKHSWMLNGRGGVEAVEEYVIVEDLIAGLQKTKERHMLFKK